VLVCRTDKVHIIWKFFLQIHLPIRSLSWLLNCIVELSISSSWPWRKYWTQILFLGAFTEAKANLETLYGMKDWSDRVPWLWVDSVNSQKHRQVRTRAFPKKFPSTSPPVRCRLSPKFEFRRRLQPSARIVWCHFKTLLLRQTQWCSGQIICLQQAFF